MSSRYSIPIHFTKEKKSGNYETKGSEKSRNAPKMSTRNPIGSDRPSFFDAHQLRLIRATRRSISQLITNPQIPMSGNRFTAVPALCL
ncbi:hypothetical protein TNCV_815881 [Trichonephila clavipes]|nr:hypothetical protein TNCV_815881 [Trichonephila clavipes]